MAIVEAEFHAKDTALANVPTMPQFIMTTAEAKRRLVEFQEFVQSCMVEDTDYGTIPGTPKPTLYKAGAEKLCEMYGLAITVDTSNKIEDWTNGFFHHEVHCKLMSRRTGEVVAEGVGSCNSKESRYRWRWVGEDEIPPGIDKSRCLSKQTPKWVFDSDIPDGVDRDSLPRQTRTSRKTNKPYQVYNIGQTSYRIENDDSYTLANTILKMAKKRALVDAALSATRSSGMFTQDIEDLAGIDTEAENTAATAKAAATTPPPQAQTARPAPRPAPAQTAAPAPSTLRAEVAELVNKNKLGKSLPTLIKTLLPSAPTSLSDLNDEQLSILRDFIQSKTEAAPTTLIPEGEGR